MTVIRSVRADVLPCSPVWASISAYHRVLSHRALRLSPWLERDAGDGRIACRNTGAMGR